ncbi:diaminopimelate epimerase [Lutibacter sp.]|uniref:diaminopimelate epimerase n=1 Tax=Lutibacter sp. TaxID=1925666 RepID=UPI0027330A52|nr:diaminopimelate epimerase [Lutibacter sp.]MDP3312979.1 diaminopimelate epimerase [Lutibacter sp.]
MKIHFYKYQGAGNDFILIDNRNLEFPKTSVSTIQKLCNRNFGIGADGLILLENCSGFDFKMIYYNADGNEGSMCGNGGRCVTAFANHLKLIKSETNFIAIDGGHFATIENDLVNLQMKNVSKINVFDTHVFLNTGSPHHIQFSPTIKAINVKEEGAKIRNGAPYFKEGTNVNFTEQCSEDSFKVRTFERGVEDETLACGTGVTAVALAAFETGKTKHKTIIIEVLGGKLEVSFEKENNLYYNVFLKGPAALVFEGSISI